jgi:hypothetical protein
MLNFNKKTVLALAVLLTGAAILGTFVYFQQTGYKKVLSDNEALLIIDYGQGRERWFKGEVIEGMTISDVLQTSSRAGSFNLSANGSLAALDGLTSNQEKQWKCYLNNREIQEDLDKKIISPKDKISCRYR